MRHLIKYLSFKCDIGLFESLQNPEIWTPEEQQIIQGILDDLGLDDQYDSDNFAIRWASGNSQLEIVKLLLKDPAVDPSARDSYSIIWASKNGSLDIVKELLKDPRVDPSGRNNQAINWASKNGHTEIFNLLKSVEGMPGSIRVKFLNGDHENGDTIQNLNDFGMFEKIKCKNVRHLINYRLFNENYPDEEIFEYWEENPDIEKLMGEHVPGLEWFSPEETHFKVEEFFTYLWSLNDSATLSFHATKFDLDNNIEYKWVEWAGMDIVLGKTEGLGFSIIGVDSLEELKSAYKLHRKGVPLDKIASMLNAGGNIDQLGFYDD